MSTLPDVPGGQAAASPGSLQANPPHRILVVDDDPYICNLSTEVLIRHGYQVHAAEDGDRAWEVLQVNTYDLVITDHKMPKLTGVELLRKLYSARITVPAILATSALPAEELNRTPWLQPAAILLKPFSPAQLLGTVKAVLRPADGSREQIAPAPVRQSQPLADGLQL